MEENKVRVKVALILVGFLSFIMIIAYKLVAQIIDSYVFLALITIVPAIVLSFGLQHIVSFIVWFHKMKYKTDIDSYKILINHTKKIPVLKLSILTVAYSLVTLFALIQLHLVNENNANPNSIDFTILAYAFCIYYIIFHVTAALWMLQGYTIKMKNKKRTINLGYPWKHLDKKPVDLLSYSVFIVLALPNLHSSQLTIPASIGLCFVSSMISCYLLNRRNLTRTMHESIADYLNIVTLNSKNKKFGKGIL